MTVLLEPRYCECGRKGICYNTRAWSEHVWRRYQCQCGKRWSTSEIRAENEPRGAVVTHRIR